MTATSTSDNLRHWNALGRTDPEHTKPFQRAGGFRGTAIKPIWIELQLTEHFGPAGIGWGMDKPEFQLVPAGEELMVYCTVALWYSDPSVDRAYVWGVGGDKVVTKQQRGLFADDEAFKKAYTDALSNAMKHIGVAADVHMGRFDDSKYVGETKRAFARGDKMSADAIRTTLDPGLAIKAYGAARAGLDHLAAFWDTLRPSQKAALKPLLDTELKPLAAQIDTEQNPAGSSSAGAPSGQLQRSPADPEGAFDAESTANLES